MYKIYSDESKNRLYIVLEHLEEKDATEMIGELNRCVESLTKGFSCLVDIRNMVAKGTPAELDRLEIIQGALYDSGMADVVRVVTDDSLDLYKTMEAESIEVGYTSRTALSVEDAENILDGK